MGKMLRISSTFFKPTSSDIAYHSIPKSTSSSFPWYVKKSIISDYLIKSCDLYYNNPTGDLLNYPISILYRTQVSRSNKLKFRTFYPVSSFIAILEKRLFHNLILYFEQNKDTAYVLGNTFIDLSKRYLKWQAYPFILSLDFEKFDLSINNTLLDLAFSFLRKHLVLSSKNEEKLFFEIVEYHKNCLIFNRINGKVICYNKNKGLISGSALTNLLGSIVNLFMVVYYKIETNAPIILDNVAILGDDIVIPSHKFISIENISKYYFFNYIIK